MFLLSRVVNKSLSCKKIICQPACCNFELGQWPNHRISRQIRTCTALTGPVGLLGNGSLVQCKGVVCASSTITLLSFIFTPSRFVVSSFTSHHLQQCPLHCWPCFLDQLKLQLTNPLSFCLNRWFNRAYTNGFTAEFNIISIVAAAQISSLGL